MAKCSYMHSDTVTLLATANACADENVTQV